LAPSPRKAPKAGAAAADAGSVFDSEAE